MNLFQHHRLLAGLITASSVIMVLAMLMITSIAIQARALRDAYQDDLSTIDIAGAVDETDVVPDLKRRA